MAEILVIRPSTKLVLAGYALVVLILAALAYAVYGIGEKCFSPWHLLALLLFYGPVKSHILTRIVSLTLESDHLTMEAGLFSRSRRTFDLAKIQDVTAKQSFGQRLIGTGDLMIETAGERSAMTMSAIDDPRGVAEAILERSRHRVQRIV